MLRITIVLLMSCLVFGCEESPPEKAAPPPNWPTGMTPGPGTSPMTPPTGAEEADRGTTLPSE